jgi:hypothetical protein
MKGYRENGGIAPHILDQTVQQLYPPGKSPLVLTGYVAGLASESISTLW